MNPIPSDLSALPHVDAVCAHWMLTTRRLALQSNAYAAHDAGLAEPVITTFVAGDESKFGFAGRTRESKPSAVQMYPNVQAGRHPWDAWKTDGWESKKLNDLQSLTVDLQYRWDADGDANAALDLWLVKDPNAVGADNIACEVMLWLDKRGTIQPAGELVEPQVPFITIGDASVSLWMRTGGESGWPIFTFVNGPAFDAPIELAALLHHLVHRGSIAKDNEFYVSAVEFGPEVIAGEYWMLYEKFDVKMT